MIDVNKLTLQPPYVIEIVASYLMADIRDIYRLLTKYHFIHIVKSAKHIIILNDDILYYDEYINKYVFTEYGFKWIKDKLL